MKSKFQNLIDSNEIKRLDNLAKAAKKQEQSDSKRKRVPYSTPLPMAVSKVETKDFGELVNVDVYVDDSKPIPKQFRFYDSHPYYLNTFAYNINPEYETLADIVGKPFWGEVVRTGPYENVRALSEEEIEELEDADNDYDYEEEGE